MKGRMINFCLNACLNHAISLVNVGTLLGITDHSKIDEGNITVQIHSMVRAHKLRSVCEIVTHDSPYNNEATGNPEAQHI